MTTTEDIHSCSYYCTRPACVLAQRDELRDTNGAGNQVPPSAQPAAQPVQPQGWQPIETAPQDGSMFLVWIDGVRFGEDDDGHPYEKADGEVDFAQWRVFGEHGGCVDCFGNPYPYDQWGATHWMPLPARPGASHDQ